MMPTLSNVAYGLSMGVGFAVAQGLLWKRRQTPRQTVVAYLGGLVLVLHIDSAGDPEWRVGTGIVALGLLLLWQRVAADGEAKESEG